MNNQLIKVMESGREQIVERWGRQLEINLRGMGWEPPGVHRRLVESLFDEVILLLGMPRNEMVQFMHQPSHLEGVNGIRPRLAHQFEVMLTGEEVVEDFLVENAHLLQCATEAGASYWMDETHRVFHILIHMEVNGFCGKCVQPLMDKARHVVGMALGARLTRGVA